MKKMICVILATITLLCFTACGKKEDKSATDRDSGSQSVSVDGTEALKEKTISRSNLPRKYNVPLANVYIDAPAWQEIEKGTTEVFIVQEEKFVSVTVSFDKANNPQEVHTLNGNSMMANLENFFMPQKITVESDSTDNVNGVDVYYYEGHISCGKAQPYDAYVVGYDFIINDTPVSIHGGVISKDQPEDVKAEIKATVEEMMSTLRDTE